MLNKGAETPAIEIDADDDDDALDGVSRSAAFPWPETPPQMGSDSLQLLKDAANSPENQCVNPPSSSGLSPTSQPR